MDSNPEAQLQQTAVELFSSSSEYYVLSSTLRQAGECSKVDDQNMVFHFHPGSSQLCENVESTSFGCICSVG